MELTGKRALVTGGAGFIGSHLVDVLIEEGCFVRVFDDLSNGRLENLHRHKDSNQFQFILGSVIDPFDTARAVEGIDIAFHLACLGVRHSIVHPFGNHRVNSEGTLLVLQHAYKAGVQKFVYCSSSEVYGSADYAPMPETHPTNPCTIYGASKLSGEAYTRAYHKTYGLDTVIIRPFNCYGPRSHHEGDAGEVIPKSIVRALNGQPILIFGDGSQTRDFTFVEDTARGLLQAGKCDHAVGLTLNLGSNSEISIKQVAEIILDLTGNQSSGIRYCKSRPGDVSRLHADANAFYELTKWNPEVSFRDGLLRTVEWFRSRPEGLSTLLGHESGINWEVQ